MSDEAALLQSIIAHADEDTPRLVYADWLDEHGDPDRAEFIRVQCRLADMPPSDPEWCDPTAREAELVPRLRGGSVNLPAHARDLQAYRRGFPFSVGWGTQYEGWTDREVHRATELLPQLVASTTIRGVYFNAVPQWQFANLATDHVFGGLQTADILVCEYLGSRNRRCGVPATCGPFDVPKSAADVSTNHHLA